MTTNGISNYPMAKAVRYTDSNVGDRTEAILVPCQQTTNANSWVSNHAEEVFGGQDKINDKQISQLMDQGYTRGLARSLNATKKAFANRIWIIDNSGSMRKDDGHRVVPTTSKNDVKFVPCSRWEEIQECVRYHIQLAGNIHAPTTFRLLNRPDTNEIPQEFHVRPDELDDHNGVSAGSFDASKQRALTLIRKTQPGGCTPLTSHIQEIYQQVFAMTPRLRASGQRVVIVIATDGLPTDERGYGDHAEKQDFVESLRLLEGLPVWLVIRLCTDDEDVVNFYNDLDSCLELSVEVLDDFTAEATEVYECNPWLTYGLPLHRMREMGYHDRVFDMLDERLLTKTELRDFMSLLFGEDKMDGVPDPAVNWDGFLSHVEQLLRNEEPTWNPLKKKMKPWISMKKLDRIYRYGSLNTSLCVIL